MDTDLFSFVRIYLKLTKESIQTDDEEKPGAQNLSQQASKRISDQGFHYTNPAYIELVKGLKMTQSMSRKGNCIDNAPIESFFGHMKDELDYKSCQSFEQLRLAIDEYPRYYNHERKQWTRKRMTPVAFRDHLLTKVEGLGGSSAVELCAGV